MTVRYTLPVGGRDREALVARLWAVGSSGIWDRDDDLVAWFPEATEEVPPGGTWDDEPARDWLAEWKRGLHPIRIGPFVITPSWQLHEVADDDPIVIDPAMAFGTGHHATTRLCLERLLELDLPGARVLDVGTGTGILAIAAHRRGAGEVVALDTDPEAVRAAEDNAVRNGAQVEILHGDLRAVADRPPFDVVVANLVTDTVLSLADELVHATRTGGWLITSGIGRDRCHEVAAALQAAGATTPTVRAGPTWSEVTTRRAT